MIRIFPHYRNGYSFLHGFDLYVGPWAIGFSWPWIPGSYTKSRWTTGWFRWEEDREFWSG